MFLEEVYKRNIAETISLLKNVSHWQNDTTPRKIFRKVRVALEKIDLDDLEDKPMYIYLAMVNNVTGKLLEKIEDLNLRSLLFCRLNRRLWTKSCGPWACSLKEPDCDDCLKDGCRGYLVAVKVREQGCGPKKVPCSG